PCPASREGVRSGRFPQRRLTMRHGLPAVILLTTLVSAGRAELHFPVTEAYAGEVKSGAPLVRRFEMVNRGPAAVEGQQIGCGCVKPKLEPAVESLPLTLPPGGKRTVLVEVNTLSQAEGEQSWQATVVWTEAGRAMEQPLVIRGKVVTEVSVTPAALFVFTD